MKIGQPKPSDKTWEGGGGNWAVIFQNLTGRCDLNGYLDFLLRQALSQSRLGVCVKNIFWEHVRSAQPEAVSHWVLKIHGSL
jgi:hypothetical protein